jgi:phosphomannomutase
VALIKSISGIRGTIGGVPGDNLTPLDTVRFAAAYGTWLLQNNANENIKVVIGRDARLSGQAVSNLVSSTLQMLGIHVVDLGLSTTPTVEVAVPLEQAHGGIILTASHNPKQWNALKLLNNKGEFISGKEGQKILQIAEKDNFTFCDVNKIGNYEQNTTYMQKHIEMILNLPLVDIEAIKAKNYKIVVDAVNSTGGIFVPALLKALGVKEIIELNCEVTGNFAHNPEPLPENLTEIATLVSRKNAHLGIVVDPDVDRLALITESGDMFGEEYTLVAVADYILKNKVGNTVSNLSSTKALKDVTLKYGGEYAASAVGEVNVVELMKQNNAIVGGEGNGGIIYPELHYGRDALVGIALFLTHLAKSGKSVSALRATYPNYYISKNKIELTPDIDVDKILKSIQKKYKKQPISTIDGVKIEFENEWVHLRKSNTEPIIRIYCESQTLSTADYLAQKIISDIREIVKEKDESIS